MTWTKEPPLGGRPNPCGCCPPIPGRACLTKGIAVGFGEAYLARDGVEVFNGERIWHNTGEAPTFAIAEHMAAKDPDHDWRIHLHGAMHGEVYQRQGECEWLLIKKDDGFA